MGNAHAHRILLGSIDHLVVVRLVARGLDRGPVVAVEAQVERRGRGPAVVVAVEEVGPHEELAGADAGDYVAVLLPPGGEHPHGVHHVGEVVGLRDGAGFTRRDVRRVAAPGDPVLVLVRDRRSAVDAEENCMGY